MGEIGYRRALVRDNIQVNHDLYHLLVEVDMNGVEPGHFIMVWIPELEEVPMAPSMYRDGVMRITYKVVGETTRYMSSLSIGDEVYIRGPLGKPFDLSMDGEYLLIGGGVGAAPLIFAVHRLAEMNYRYTYVEGVPNKDYKMFIDEALSLGGEAILYTEDGSEGLKGLPTDYLREHLGKYDYILACGPEALNKTVYKICKDSNIHCQISMERMVKCGVGVCGSCVVENTGLLVCLDGPVFNVSILKEKEYDC